MRLKLKYWLEQEAGSTPTTTSGAEGSDNEGASNTPSDDKIDWAAISEPDQDVEQNDVPAEEDTPEEKPAPPTQKPQQEQQQPQQKPTTGQEQQPPQPDQGKDGEQEKKQTPASTPQPTPPGPQQETPEQKQAREAAEAQAREKFEHDLQEYYKLPDDLAARMQTEPEAVMPVLAAKLHQTVLGAAERMLNQVVPQMLEHHRQITEANNKAREAFYSRWPSLKGKDEHVIQIATMYGQLNPNATPQERLENVGKMVCAGLGITPDPAPGPGTTSPNPPPPQPTRQQPTFRPAGTSGSQAGATVPSDNLFTQMANEMLEEDQR